MRRKECPICGGPLEARTVAPCMDCGAEPEEVRHAEAGRHCYAEMKIFGDLSLVLCDFCRVDFSS